VAEAAAVEAAEVAAAEAVVEVGARTNRALRDSRSRTDRAVDWAISKRNSC